MAFQGKPQEKDPPHVGDLLHTCSSEESISEDEVFADPVREGTRMHDYAENFDSFSAAWAQIQRGSQQPARESDGGQMVACLGRDAAGCLMLAT